jgi:hypothetical protein
VRKEGDVRESTEPLWRIHRGSGSHILAWHELRGHGPLPSMRWDPHPEPIRVHAGEGVLYAALDVTTAAAEAFQAARRLDVRSDRPRLTGWTPTRGLRLLDLTGDWALRNGAAHALAPAHRATCRAWARAIRAEWPDLDGLWAPSTMTGRPVVVLWQPAGGAFPAAPAFSRPLEDPAVGAVVSEAARSVGYRA